MRKSIVIILMLVGFSSFGQTPSSSDTANMLKQSAVWKFPNKIWFKGNVFITNVVRKSNGQQRILVQNTNTGRIEYIDSTNFVGNYWSTSGNTFSNGNYLGTSNNRGLPIVINGKKQVYFDTLAGVNLYDRNASRILSIYKNNSAASRTGTVYNSRPDSTNSSKSGHIFIADGANTSPASGTYYSTVAIQQGSLSTSGTGIASSLLVHPSTIIQSSGSGYISGITINSGNTIGGGALYFRGLDIPNCGNNSNAYGIHQADAVGRNYFAASTQFGSTTTSTSAQVQINSTTKGFLPPVMTNAQKNAISSPATGLVVYDNGTNKLNYYNGSSWRGLDSSSGGSSYTAGRGLTLNSNIFGLDSATHINWLWNGAASLPAFRFSGTPFSGTGTTSTPLVLFQETATAASTTWNTAGTYFGINTPSGSLKDVVNIKDNGTTILKLSNNGGSGNGLITAISNNPTDPTTGLSTGANFGYNGSSTNFYGSGLGSLRNSKYDMWWSTGNTNGGGYRWYQSATELMSLSAVGDLSIGGALPITNSKLSILVAATPSSAYGLKSSGSGNFTGSGVQPFAGAAGGTVDAINTAANTAANFADWQHKGIKKFSVDSTGTQTFEYTNTATATTGNQTINKTSGQVNIAATGTTVTVTNDRVSANSIVMAVIMTDDATATLRNVVVSAGSFVINIVACTSETRIGWFVINR